MHHTQWTFGRDRAALGYAEEVIAQQVYDKRGTSASLTGSSDYVASQVFGPRRLRPFNPTAGTNVTIVTDAMSYTISATGGGTAGDSDQTVIPIESFTRHWPHQKTVRATGSITVTEDALGYIVGGGGGSGDSDQVILPVEAFSHGLRTSPPIGMAGGDLTGTYPNPTVKNNAITPAKLDDGTAFSVLGRASSPAGDRADITAGSDTVLLRAGATDIAFAKVNTNQITDNAILNSKIRDSVGFSVIGRTGSLTADPDDIVAADNTVFGRANGSNLVFAQVATNQVADDQVTYAKMQNVSAASRLIGRGSAGGAGDPEEITLGAGLGMSGTTLSETPDDASAVLASVAFDSRTKIPTGAAGGDLEGAYPNPTVKEENLVDGMRAFLPHPQPVIPAASDTQNIDAIRAFRPDIVQSHNILSHQHIDTLKSAGNATRGDIFVVGDKNLWTRLAIGLNGKFLKSNGTDPSWQDSAGGPPTLTTVEVSLGSAPDAHRSGNFNITGGFGASIGKPVQIQQASGPYTGKGTRRDEAEMDQVLVTGIVENSFAILCHWKSQHRTRGNFKFNYVISA